MSSKKTNRKKDAQPKSSTIQKKFDVKIETHQLKCDAGNRSRGFTLGGETPSMILTVRRNSPAEKAGLKNGDFVLQVDRKVVHMLSSEQVEKTLSLVSRKMFDVVVAHVNPWPKNLTERKYAVNTIKKQWEAMQGQKWGPLKVGLAGDEIDGQGHLVAPANVLSGETPEIKGLDDGADIVFREEMDSDEDPPSSGEEEETNEDKQINDWLHLFEGGKEMEVYKAAPVKSKVNKGIEKEWKDNVIGQRKSSSSAVFPRSSVTDSQKAPFEDSNSLQQQMHQVQHKQPSRSSKTSAPPGYLPYNDNRSLTTSSGVNSSRKSSAGIVPQHQQDGQLNDQHSHPLQQQPQQPQLVQQQQQQRQKQQQRQQQLQQQRKQQQKQQQWEQQQRQQQWEQQQSRSQQQHQGQQQQYQGQQQHQGQPAFNLTQNGGPKFKSRRVSEPATTGSSFESTGRGSILSKGSGNEQNTGSGTLPHSKRIPTANSQGRLVRQKKVSFSDDVVHFDRELTNSLDTTQGTSPKDSSSSTHPKGTVDYGSVSIQCSNPETATLRLTFPVRSWDSSDICTWLKQLSDFLYCTYAPCFKKYGIKGSHFFDLSHEDLQRMGIAHKQHRSTILHNLQLLRDYEHTQRLDCSEEENNITFL